MNFNPIYKFANLFLKLATLNDYNYLKKINLKALQKQTKKEPDQDPRSFYENLMNEAEEGPIFNEEALLSIKALSENHFPRNNRKPFVKWLATQWTLNPYGATDELIYIKDYVNSLDQFPIPSDDINTLTFDDVLARAHEWHEQFKHQVDTKDYSTKNVHHDFGDGFTMVEVPPEDLEIEGVKMQHCVEGYCDEVKEGNLIIYSLRDAQNEPHVTIEVNEGIVDQIKGKQNVPPIQKYAPYIRTWLEENFDESEFQHASDFWDIASNEDIVNGLNARVEPHLMNFTKATNILNDRKEYDAINDLVRDKLHEFIALEKEYDEAISANKKKRYFFEGFYNYVGNYFSDAHISRQYGAEADPLSFIYTLLNINQLPPEGIKLFNLQIKDAMKLAFDKSYIAERDYQNDVHHSLDGDDFMKFIIKNKSKLPSQSIELAIQYYLKSSALFYPKKLSWSQSIDNVFIEPWFKDINELWIKEFFMKKYLDINTLTEPSLRELAFMYEEDQLKDLLKNYVNTDQVISVLHGEIDDFEKTLLNPTSYKFKNLKDSLNGFDHLLSVLPDEMKQDDKIKNFIEKHNLTFWDDMKAKWDDLKQRKLKHDS